MTRLRHLPTPDSNTVRQLVEFSRQAWHDGFRVAEDGSLLRTAAAEDVEFDQEQDDFNKSKVEPVVEPVFGKGHRMKIKRKLHGGEDAWSL